MERILKGRIWKFGDDIDTDNIIPGKRGTIPTIEGMKKYAFEYVKPEFGAQVRPGDVVIAGKNFGCGSSREQAATVLSSNGISCVIAKSFARIFFRNGFNSGMLLFECDGIQDVCEDGDEVTIEVNRCVRVNGHEFPIKPVPDNLFDIVANGGLIADTRRRLTAEGSLANAAPMVGSCPDKQAYTLAEKLLMRNTGATGICPGDIVISRPDFFMIHDIYTPYLLDTLQKMGAEEIRHPENVTIIFDHCMPTAVAHNDSEHFRAGLALAENYGITKLHIGEGICHSLMHELHYAKPGKVATATDSHTTTYGGAGNFCTGIGTAEMAAALITGELWLKVPAAIKIVLDGKLPKGVYAKDVILKVLGDLRADGAQYKAVEFVGSAAEAMSMDERFTIANMSLEAGAKVALFAADEKTAAYYGMPYEEIAWIHADEGASYEQVLTYDVSTLVPQLSCPQGVDNVHPIEEILGTPINEVFIGSCTNGSLSDLAVAAAILEGKQVAPGMRLVVTPDTNKTYIDAMRAGYIKTFVQAGAVITHPCCGMCAGFPYGLMADDQRILLTSNRNFIGRAGTKKTLSYLCSPAVAAASALAGVIAKPI